MPGNEPSVPMSIFEFNTGLNVSNGLNSNILVTQPVQSISMDYGALCAFPSPWHENTSFGRLISAQVATQQRQPPGHVSRNFDMFSSLQALVSLAASPGNQFDKILDWLNWQIEWFSTSQLTMMLQCILQSRGTLAPRAIWEIIIQVIGAIKDVKLFETIFDIGHKMGWVHDFRQNCLMLALEIDSIDIAKRLLDDGASLFEKPQYHTSALRYSSLELDALNVAARKCNPTALQLIIEAGANVNFRNRATNHPLYTVICAKEPESLRLECAKLLLDAGADASQHIKIRPYMPSGQSMMNGLESELSLVEWAYVFAPQFYSLLHQYFASGVHLLTVDSIMIAASQGVTSLRNYLSITPYPRGQYRAVLLEKSLLVSALSTRHDRLSIVESLLGVDVHPDAPGLHRYLQSQEPYSKLSAAKSSIIANILENTSNDSFDEDSVLISKLLEHGATLNRREILGNLTKGNAAKGKVFQFLLAKGADMKAHGSIALLHAALNNDFESVWLLCRHGASILDRIESFTIFELAVLQNIPWRLKRTILDFPTRPVSVHMFEFLTKFGADESWLRNPQFIFDFLSNGEGVQQRVKILLDAGLDVNMPLPNSTVLECCLDSISEGGNLGALCKLLVSKGAKLSPELPTGRACNLFVPLIELNLDLRFAEDLISAGADVQSRYAEEDGNAKTPLQAACSIKRLDIVKLLVSNGAMVNDAIQDENLPLLLACMAGGDDALELISYLISQGANVNAECGVPHRDVSILTRATEAAAQAGDVAIMIQLLNSGAILNAGWLMAEHSLELDWAAKGGHLQMVHLLLRSGARSYFRGTSGYDGAIRLAEEHANFAVAELIREYARFLASDVILRQDC
jgi:ankyrin repeat protein